MSRWSVLRINNEGLSENGKRAISPFRSRLFPLSDNPPFSKGYIVQKSIPRVKKLYFLYINGEIYRHMCPL